MTSKNHEQEETEGTECRSFLRCLCSLLLKMRRKTRNRAIVIRRCSHPRRASGEFSETLERSTHEDSESVKRNAQITQFFPPDQAVKFFAQTSQHSRLGEIDHVDRNAQIVGDFRRRPVLGDVSPAGLPTPRPNSACISSAERRTRNTRYSDSSNRSTWLATPTP